MKHYHCPVNDTECPYYTDLGHPCRCLLTNPYEECDDFYGMYGDDADEEDYTDDDWRPCDTCCHGGDETLEDVSCCNCCEVGEFYRPDDSEESLGLKKYIELALKKLEEN